MTEDLRARIVAEARAWVGTPFHHQASTRGVGCDCAGLLKGVALAVGLLPPDYASRPEYRELFGYGRLPQGERLTEICNRFMRPVARARMRAGDAVLVRIASNPRHLGILIPWRKGLGIVHAACTSDGRYGSVIEHRLMFHHRMEFVSAYAFPGVSD